MTTDTADAGWSSPPTPRGAPSTRSAMIRQFLRLYLVVMFPFILITVAGGWFFDKFVTMPNFVEQVRHSQAARFEFVRARLAAIPVGEWKAQIDATRQLYPTGLRLEEASKFFSTVHPVDDEMRRFERGEVAFAPEPVEVPRNPAKPGATTFSFVAVPGTQLVLSNDLSFAEAGTLLAYVYYLLFSVVVASPILWFWFRPFWRDLERLGRVTEQIGSGDFSVHAAPVRSAAVQPFAAAIDQMSLRIAELIDVQRRLTNGVAHELTTPITQLVFALTMLKESPDPDKAQRLIDGMTSDLNELESLVAELLENARLEHAAVFEPESVGLRQLLERAVESAQHTPGSGKVVALEMAPGELSTRVRCDAHQMHRAILNLLRNALRYARARVVLSAEHRGDRMWIHVDDDGPGIPSAERAHVFEPFARTDASRTRETGGHGLGLAIVQQVAKLHGGVSWIEVSPLGGARVSIEW